jgi:hypothetical protein
VLEVGLTDIHATSEAVRHVRAELNASIRVSGSGSIALGKEIEGDASVRLATFSFAQLLSWKRSSAPEWLSNGDVMSVDIDERKNKIVVGVRFEKSKADVARILASAGAAVDAYEVNLEAPTRQARQATNLYSRQRPLTAGFVGNYPPKNCPITATAFRGFEMLLLTNAHCTAQSYFLDGGPVSQGDAVSFGNEVSDPGTYGCGTFFRPRRCRRADIAAYSVAGISPQPGDTLTFQLGLIARTQYVSNGLTLTPGSLEIDPVRPYWYIQAERTSVLQGMTLHKVGGATGWTYGDVFGTCVDVRDDVTQVFIVCSDRANLFVNAGDSGSPVFIINDAVGVTFVGAVWGGNGLAGTFSSLGQIKQDLGNVRTF